MMLGHVVGGLALFGGSILAATIAVALAGMSGMRHLRKLLSGHSFRVVQLDDTQYTDVAEPEGSDYANVLQLDRSQYSDVAEPEGSDYTNVLQLDRSQYTDVAEAEGSDYTNVLQLDRSQYTEVR